MYCTVNVKYLLTFLFLLFCGSVFAQTNCWPNCGANHEITLAFRMRRPALTISGSDVCRAEVRKMVEDFDLEDQALTNFARNACAALSGWVEIDPGSCNLGGPLCCTAKPSHWTRDASAWSRFKSAQTKIGEQRKAQVEAYLKRCSSTSKVSTTGQPPATSTEVKGSNTQNTFSNRSATQQQTSSTSSSSIYTSNQQTGFPKISSSASTQQLPAAAIQQNTIQNAFLEELSRKETEKQMLQDQLNLKAQNNFTIQQLGNDLTQLANKKMVDNFGSDVRQNNTFITNPLQSNSSSNSNGLSKMSELKELTGKSSSLDDFSLDTQLTATPPPVIPLTDNTNLLPLGLSRDISPEWKEMWEKEYQKFLTEVEKDPELKKKGSKLVKLPNGQIILFETPDAKMKRLRMNRSKASGMGHRG